MKRKMPLKTLGTGEHNHPEQWNVIFHNDFVPEFKSLPLEVQDELAALVLNLRKRGPLLGRPQVDTLKASGYPNMKELRHGVWRVAFAFDFERNAILLVAGNKSGVGKNRFYRDLIRIADARFKHHLETLPLRKGS